MASNLSKVTIPRATGNRLSGDVVTRLGGLDLINSPENIAEGRTPDAHDFRLYNQTEGGRQAAVTSRKGAGLYTIPLGEHASTASVSTDSADTVAVGVETGLHAQPFIALHNEHLTRLDLDVAAGTATSVLRVDIYGDEEGMPGSFLSSSSFVDIPDEHDYVSARFLNAPLLESGERYWFVIYIQDDGLGFADVQTTTSPEDGFAWSGSNLVEISETVYGLNYEVFTSPAIEILGKYRFNQDDGVNQTLVAIGTTMYIVDETTSGYKPIVTGLSPNASRYSFDTSDRKVFWVNGHDKTTWWDGTFEEDNPNIVQNPSFDTDTSGWTSVGASTLTRNTTDFHSSPASLQIATNTTPGVGVRYNFPFNAHKRYKVTFWAKASTTRQITFGFTGSEPQTLESLSTTWKKYELYYYAVTPQESTTRGAVWSFNNVAGNVFIDDVEIKETGIGYITDGDAPILDNIVFHKNRVMGKMAENGSTIAFSEEMGNPSNAHVESQWYNAWLTVSKIAVPRPFYGSPVTNLISFQDSLIITTQDEKYVLSGSDRGSYFLRLSTGSEGAISNKGTVNDANYIYLVSKDGIYRFNGSKDDKISHLIQPLFDNCPRKHDISLSLWNNQLKVSLASQFSTVNDITLIYDTDLEEWMLDLSTYTDGGIYYNDADDNGEFIEASSQTATLYKAEVDFSNLGGPIDFSYGLRYDSRGMPGQRKKYKRYVPLLQAVGKSFPVTLGRDKDFEDEPMERKHWLEVGGAKIGEFKIDDGTIITGATAFKPKKIPISGYSHYMQFRVGRKAVNNQVAFMGVQFTYKTKRL